MVRYHQTTISLINLLHKLGIKSTEPYLDDEDAVWIQSQPDWACCEHCG